MIGGVYAAYAIAVFAAVWKFGADRAVAPALCFGLVWLPPLVHPELWPADDWRVPGGALPTPFYLGKALVVPLVVLAAGIMFGRDRAMPRWRAVDAVVAAFCLWPLVQALLFRPAASPAGWFSAMYLSGTWGGMWLIGRRYLGSVNDIAVFAWALALSALSIIPLAVFESISGLRVYERVIGAHPFADVGQERWLGSRPLAFFEDGNQYGLWMACAAFAALWLTRFSSGNSAVQPMALVLVIASLASQSMGAIILLAAAATVLFVPRLRGAMVAGAAVAMTAGGLAIVMQIAGIVDMRSLILGNPIGRAAYEGLRATGRGSAAWRFGQDAKSFPAIRDQLLAGTGQWDWFVAGGTRPWGFPQLLLGQFGAVGLCLLGLCGLVIARGQFRAGVASGQSGQRYPTVNLLGGMLVVMAAIDTVFNSFIFYPAIALSAALVTLDQTAAANPNRNAAATI